MKQIAVANPFTGIAVPVTQPANIVNVNSTNLGNIITQLLPYVFALAAILLLIYLVLGGLQLMTSQGDPKAVEGARAKITNALIGLIVIVLAYAIVKLLGQILGITVFGLTF